MKKIILASTSERRKELLMYLIGNNFEVMVSSYDEDNALELPPKDLVMLHSLQKGRDVAGKLSDGIIISADVLVDAEGKVLGKPKDANEAREMLRRMSGRTVDVFSGIAVIDASFGKELRDFEITKVRFKQMTEDEINDYVASGEPLGKAGSFGIQGKAAALIERIEGDYSNILGLPLFKLSGLLAQMGVNIFDYR
ncbi:MAG: Maf family nucleotide pyrophosphatase [Candidatus Pacebacteria bacterium]|nr:Maf family nucleotide pyrophosphatase [Candidatus Paceibacterota bacterium]